MSNNPPAPALRPPQWVYDRITAVADGSRYEASLYGPLNCFLFSYFPMDRYFMVKPQPKIRYGYTSDPGDRPSVDSYHAEVLPRTYGNEPAAKSPDFIVVKATAARDNDRLLLVVEVKPGNTMALETNAVEQLSDYLELLAEKTRSDTNQPLSGELCGLLVRGTRVMILKLDILGDTSSTGFMSFNSATVHSFLHNIAASN